MKSRAYNAAIPAIVLFGCELWLLREDDIRQLPAFKNRRLHTIVRLWEQKHVVSAKARQRALRVTSLCIYSFAIPTGGTGLYAANASAAPTLPCTILAHWCWLEVTPQ